MTVLVCQARSSCLGACYGIDILALSPKPKLQIDIKRKITSRGATAMTLPNPIKPWSLWDLTACWRRTKESTTLSKTQTMATAISAKLTLISLISLTESSWRWTGRFSSSFLQLKQFLLQLAQLNWLLHHHDFAFVYRNNKC